MHARWIILTRAKRKNGFTFEPSRYRLNSINARTNNSESMLVELFRQVIFTLYSETIDFRWKNRKKKKKEGRNNNKIKRGRTSSLINRDKNVSL